MRLKEFNQNTLKDDLKAGFSLFEKNTTFSMDNKNDLYHFHDVNTHEVKIILDKSKILYAYCDCGHDTKGYCEHEVACFLKIIKLKDPNYNIDQIKLQDSKQELLIDEVLDDFQQALLDEEFDLMSFLNDKSQDDLLWLIQMLDDIYPEISLFVFQLYYDEIKKNKK